MQTQYKSFRRLQRIIILKEKNIGYIVEENIGKYKDIYLY